MTGSIVFYFSLFGALVILSLTLISIMIESFQFWPPPNRSSWQYRVFWLSFRVLFIGIIVLSIIDFGSLDMLNHPLRVYTGLLVAVIGLSLAFYITFYMGWRNAHGEAEGLKTEGWFAWSRNPVYCVSIFGFVGWALAVNSAYVYVLFTILIMFYIISVFLEESWLEKIYAKDYLDYKEKVPRFIAFLKMKPN